MLGIRFVCSCLRVISICQKRPAISVSLLIECVILKGWCCKILENNYSENGPRYFEEIRRTRIKRILQIGIFLLRTDRTSRPILTNESVLIKEIWDYIYDKRQKGSREHHYPPFAVLWFLINMSSFACVDIKGQNYFALFSSIY